ncbi:hypothetical protein DV735_g846, partial [Chaetothyriales sp. CBS 134920]
MADPLELFKSSHLAVYIAAAAFCLLCYGACLVWNAISPIDRQLHLGSSGGWKLPPGPKGVPILGNLLNIKGVLDDTRQELIKLAEHGEMTTLRLGSQTWILLNSQRVTHEIIAKRGNITTERSHMPISSGIVSRDMRSLLQGQSRWTENRRVMHHLLSGGALNQYGAWQELESTQMMAEYLYHPDQWYSHHYRYANSVVHRIALGTRIEATGEDLGNLQRLVAEFTGSIGSSLIEWFPVLDRLPRFLQFWRPYWEKVGQFHNDVYHKWYDPTQAAVQAGTAPPSWTRDVLLNPDSKYSGNAEEGMYCAMQLIEAGSDTTREALNIFIMAMIHHPQVFAKLRAEVDGICDVDGSLRSATLADLDNLPYTAATVKEVLRWRPIFPLTPPHTLSKDLEFEGYRFPAGVSFVINGISVARECDRPDEFDPSRWIDGNEFNVAHGLWQFGGGRRICVGYRLAQRGLILNIARLVQCFDFSARGQLDSYKLNHETTTEPFPITVRVRGERYAEMIDREAAEADVLTAAKRRREAAPAYTYERPMAL